MAERVMRGRSVAALLTLAAVVLSGCGSDDVSIDVPDVSADCTVNDYASSRQEGGLYFLQPTSRECGHLVVRVEFTTEGLATIRTSNQFHGLSALRGLGELAEGATVEEWVDQANTRILADFERSTADTPVAYGETEGATKGEYLVAEDVMFEIQGHTVVAKHADVDETQEFSEISFDDGAIIVDGIDFLSNGYGLYGPIENRGAGWPTSLIVTFPGPVAETNGEVSGNSVLWEWGIADQPDVYAVYRP